MNFDDFKYHSSRLPSGWAEKKLFYEDLKRSLREELNRDPAIVDYFSKFDPLSVESFKIFYADSLIKMIEEYQFYLDREHETKELRYRAEAEKVFELIRQKKLFNMQLLWRAEKIRIPGLNVSYHFECWGSHINDCPFLDEITPEELEVMKDFLVDPSYSTHTREWLDRWQSYTWVMPGEEEEAYNGYDDDEEDPEAYTNGGLPEWYRFYDERMGTGGLLKLGNKRGEKEERYMEAARQQMREEKAISNRENPVEIPKPRYSLNSEHQAIFHESFQKDEHLKFLGRIYFRMRDEDMKDWDGISRLQEAMYLLQESEEPVYLSPDYEWKDAILLAAQQYQNKMIAGQLDAIYEEYLLYRGLGINPHPPKADVDLERYLANYEERVLKGRKLLGEPEDFNY